MNDDTISRRAAIDAIEFGITYARAINKETGGVKELFQEGNKELRKAAERVKALSSAQPEIIRCRDCKHWTIGTENLNCPNPMICGLHSFMHGFERAALPEDYCSWAKKKDDD